MSKKILIILIYGRQGATSKSDFGFMANVSQIFINKNFLSNKNLKQNQKTTQLSYYCFE